MLIGLSLSTPSPHRHDQVENGLPVIHFVYDMSSSCSRGKHKRDTIQTSLFALVLLRAAPNGCSVLHISRWLLRTPGQAKGKLRRHQKLCLKKETSRQSHTARPAPLHVTGTATTEEKENTMRKNPFQRKKPHLDFSTSAVKRRVCLTFSAA